MSNFSKEKVLEWVNSSEARAAKYEQEAKDLRRKIEKLQEKLDSIQEEIDQKNAAADDIEDQLDNFEYGVIKRREGMELLQNVADDKLEQVQKIEVKLSILNGSFLSDSYQESLKPSTFIQDVLSIAEQRSKLSFDDIQYLTNLNSKTHSDRLQSDTQDLRQENFTNDYKQFKSIQNLLNRKCKDIEMSFKEKRAKMRMSLGGFAREKDKLDQIEKKISKVSIA